MSNLHASEIDYLAKIVEAHASSYPLTKLPLRDTIQTFYNGSIEIKPRLIASLLRLADELDISSLRINEIVFQIFRDVCNQNMPQRSYSYWMLHAVIENVRIKCLHQNVLVINLEVNRVLLNQINQQNQLRSEINRNINKLENEIHYVVCVWRNDYNLSLRVRLYIPSIRDITI